MVIEISISGGNIVIIDEIDSDLQNVSWYRKNKQSAYAIRDIKNIKIPMHRVILQRKLGRFLTSDETVDHINGNTLDNRRCNLRCATPSQQSWNSKKIKDIDGKPTTSVYKGVSWYPRFGMWRADIRYNKHKIHLLYTKSEIEAAHAYDKKARELFGEFAKTNF